VKKQLHLARTLRRAEEGCKRRLYKARSLLLGQEAELLQGKLRGRTGEITSVILDSSGEFLVLVQVERLDGAGQLWHRQSRQFWPLSAVRIRRDRGA
jgi:hypothetical protein